MADDYLATTLTTGKLTIGGQSSGRIEQVGDADWFAVDLTAGTAYKFYGYDALSRGGTLLGVGISLYSPSGSILASAGETDTIGYTPSLSGRYFLSAKSLYAVGTYSSTGMGSYKLRAVVATDDDYLASAQTAGMLTIGGEVRGTIETVGDRDWLAMDLVAGTTYRFAGYDASSYAGTLPGLFLSLRSPSGSSTASSSTDDMITYTPTVSGRYFLDVAGYSGRTGTYSLQALVLAGADDYADNSRTTGVLAIGGQVQGVIGLPEDRDWFGVDLVAGKTYQFDGFDAYTGGGTLPEIAFRFYSSQGTLPLAAGQKINITPTASGRYYLAAESATLNERGSYTVTATEVLADEYSANTQTAGLLPVGGRVTGVIGVAGDVDWIAVDLVAGTTYRFGGRGSGDGGGTLSNVVLALQNPSGTAVTGVSLTDGAGYTPTISGRYFLATSGGGDTGTYTLTASAYTPPTLTVSNPVMAEAGGHLIYTVALSDTSTTPVTFIARTEGGTAAVGSDYVTVNRTVTIAAGDTSATIEVSVKDDDRVEANETVGLTLLQATGAILASNAASITGTGVIVDDDLPTAAFTLDAYRALNPDLVSAFGNNDSAYVSHYVTNGKAEGRASAGFDAEAYAALNPDLFNAFGLNEDALASHYRNNGKTEGRLAEGFDAEAYAALNPDLFGVFGTSHAALVTHYVNNGKAEGRLATGFDAEAYAALNPDLFSAFGLNATSLITHYIQSGRAEGRVATGFDAEAYAALNPDLFNAFGLDHVALVNHYISNGRAEGRPAFTVELTLLGVMDGTL